MKKFILLKSIFVYMSVFLIPWSSNASESLYMMRGALAEKNGNYGEAIKEYEKALTENPDFIDLYNTIGHIYRYKLEDNEKAIEVYLRGLKISPYDFGLNRNLMYSFFDQDNLDDGIKQYRKLSDLRGEKEIYSFPRETLKKILDGMGQEPKINFCKEYLSINPTDLILREIIADMYMSMKDYEHAKTEYEAMIEYGNKTGFIYFSLGVCYYYLGIYQDSLRSFTQAQELGSYVPQKYFDRIQEKMGTKTDRSVE